MKKVMILLLPLIVLSITMCTKTENTNDQEEIIKNIITDFNKRFDYKDLTGMLEFFRDDCQWFTLNGIILKKDQIIPFFEPLIKDWKTIETEIKFYDITISDRIAIVRLATKVRIDSAPERESMKNLHTIVLKFELGEWKIWHHHMSSR